MERTYCLAKYKKVLPHDRHLAIHLYWTVGMSMSDIGYSTGLSKTKVFDILHEGNTSDDQIFLRHNLAVNLYKNVLDLIAYADLVRAQNITIRYNIGPEKILAQIREIIELCFAINLEPQKLVTGFKNFRTFVSSTQCNSRKKLERKLVLDLKLLEFIIDDLDTMMKECGRLRVDIDRLERFAKLAAGKQR